jgi:Class III cytochrome C family
MSAPSVRVVAVVALIGFAVAPLVRAETPRTPAPAASAEEPASDAKRKDFTDNVPCTACHNTSAWRARDGAGQAQKFDHSTTGFPLTGAHVGAACVDCHNATKAVKRTCSSCHEDFHRGRLSGSCDNCHSPAGWRQTRPQDIHRFTRFPLTGMHVLADCTECHQRASEQRWTDAPVACFACHEKDYRRPGIFPIHAGTATTQPLPRDCSLCHRSIAWVPVITPGTASVGMVRAFLTAPPRDHDLRFPISFGVHRTATCSDCHASQAAPRAVRCIGCHAHDSVALRQQHREPVATDGAACLSCHLGGARR